MTDQQQNAPAPGPAIMRFFDFTHLRDPRLQAVVAEFAQLAQYVVDYLPAGPEQSVALRKLLEAKDAAVRAALDGMPDRGLQPAAGGERLLGVMTARTGEVCCGGGPVAAAGEPTFREGAGGECCGGAPAGFLEVGAIVRPESSEQPAEGAGEQEGPDHG